MSALTDETTITYAQPDGSFRQTSHALPVRVREDGTWKEVDTTLVRRPDGTVAPKRAAIDVAFGAAGTDSVITLREDEAWVQLAWAGQSLPQPEIDANVVRYPDALPGVDLVIEMGPSSYTQVFEVKNRAAGRNPALRRLRFDVRATGAKVVERPNGGLAVVGRQGRAIFESMTPQAWERGTTPDGRGERSTSPDPDARQRPVGLSVADGSVTLDVPSDLLTDPKTRYPVSIDPSIGNRLAWAYVDSTYSGTSYYNATREATVGYSADGGMKRRSFFRYYVKGLNGKVVDSATFRAVNTWSWSCSAREVQVWVTGNFSSSTTWSKQPSWSSKVASKSFAYNWAPSGSSSSCAGNGGGVEFNVRSGVATAASKNWTHLVLAMRAGNESDTYAWKKFKNNPALDIKYHSRPTTPTGLSTSPSTSCSNGLVGNTDLTLKAVPRDPDGGTVYARFRVWKNGTSRPSNHTRSVKVTSGVTATTIFTQGSLTANTKYRWDVTTYAGGEESSPSTQCSFTIDTKAPSPAAVTVSSTDYPETPDNEDWVQGLPAGTPGRFTISAPGTDATAYRVGVNSHHEIEEPSYVVKPSSPGGPVTVDLVPTDEVNTVRVVLEDASGNKSAWTGYSFHAAPPLEPQGPWTPRDANNDGRPDVISVWGDDSNVWGNGSRLACLYLGSGQRSPFWGPASGCRTPIATNVTTDYRPVQVDWNADGFGDLVSLGQGGALMVQVGDGSGWYPGAVPVTRLVAGEIDEDECIDDLDACGDDVEEPVVVPDALEVHTPGDWDDDGNADLLVKASNGDVRVLHGDGNGHVQDSPTGDPSSKVDHVWTGYMIVTMGDYDGDALADIIGRDANGDLWLYPGLLGSGVGPRVKVASGWNVYERIYAAGDWDGDGHQDLFGKLAEPLGNEPAGYFQYYPGTGITPTAFEARRRAMSGWAGLTWAG
ncbi:VCBS repeat-containing protein [Phycicoccus sp. CSK15P-2]|uniref:DNRLRE domain-containing protein n=1 Tax=Phycicoccus sp. CSK15P-2 TaxID=2807627 RepID=UPI0019506589|nr:DNRLRE domain-containing protein [Phycicoccus sp. CSK15P-2]MBM6402796.1 VCBS repeat-containing protein [Phycicoccus sp. CSK15P-2]